LSLLDEIHLADANRSGSRSKMREKVVALCQLATWADYLLAAGAKGGWFSKTDPQEFAEPLRDDGPARAETGHSHYPAALHRACDRP
jgi:hypothetical protein